MPQQGYGKQPRSTKGLLRRYIAKMTGLGRAQVTRLIGRYQQCGGMRKRNDQRHRFRQRYTSEDIELLAEVDEAHETLSGPATQKILYREFYEFGEERVALGDDLSGAHL